jgi:restriction endonuclease Mrr
LVTAVHQAADEGAEVRWNDKINGRQFDVTIRFKKGLYEYLTVVECKNYETPIPVEKVEAFDTKASDAHADRAVMASTSGFWRGAQDVAARHHTIELEYSDGERKRLSEHSNEMAYYVKQVVMESGQRLRRRQ